MNAKVLAVIVGIFVILVACLGIVSSSSPKTIDPTTDSINMVQPCGWFWCSSYDQQYAEHVNLPNSQANENNGQANLYNAQATAVALNSQNIALTNQDLLTLPFLYICTCGLSLVLLGVLIYYSVRKGKPYLGE